MASSNFVVNSAQFTPLSFDDYIKPLALLNEQHQKLDDAYLELYTKASTVEQMANEQTDPEVYKQYKNYANDLRSAIDVLNKNGLTPSSRSQMLTMARRYGDEVAPIQSAYTRRAADITAQREALMKDQSVRFSRKASESSLMDYIKNPSLSYDSMSGAMITADVASKVKNLKNQILTGGVTPWSKTLGGQQFERMVSTGLSTKDIADIMANPNKYPEFTELVKSAVLASGVGEWGSPEDIAYAMQQAYNGLWEGIGTDKMETIENKDLSRAYMAEQIATMRDKRLHPEKYKTGSSSGKSGGESSNGLHYRPETSVISAKERERYNNRESDLKFMNKIMSSNKDLNSKDRERLQSIAKAYHITPNEETGQYNTEEIKNAIVTLDKERYRPYYVSTLSDSSRLLESLGREISTRFRGKDLTEKEMQEMFAATSEKGWKSVKLGKKNGVEQTMMDVMDDILSDSRSKIALDPASGQLIVIPGQHKELGNIVLYDFDKHGNKSPVLHNSNIAGMRFEDIMGRIYDNTAYDYMYGNDEDYQAETQGLIELLFRYLTAYNNTAIPVPGNTKEDSRVYPSVIDELEYGFD